MSGNHAVRWAWGRLMRAGLIVSLLALSAVAAAQTVTYFHNDVSGTPLLATDSSGNVVWKENYRPYGERLDNPSAEAGNAIGFAGKPYDATTGLSYVGARYYDPVLGRFMGMDPAPADPGNVHGFNRYAYANNNPYHYVDPDGHSPIDVAFLVWDLGKLGFAVYSGNGAAIAEAGVDVGLSLVGVVSPVPGVGEAIKAARAAERGVEAIRAAEHGVEALRGAERAEGAAKAVTDVSKKAPVVIGEGMKERVIPAAKEVGGHIYRPRDGWTAAKQERWAKDMKRDVSRGNRDLIDVGHDLERKHASEAYSIERRIFYGEPK